MRIASDHFPISKSTKETSCVKELLKNLPVITGGHISDYRIDSDLKRKFAAFFSHFGYSDLEMTLKVICRGFDNNDMNIINTQRSG